MPAANNNIRYDIVFLRCLAVVSVLCFHFKLPIFHDGYAGVDVFFVLSGFLMTRIIVEDLQAGQFKLWSFYYRRLARILPALLGALLFFLLLIYGVLGVKLYDYSRVALSSSIFVSNIYYYQASGYFAPSSQLNFLLHTWSLSVEWQFYMIYPLIWLGLSKFLENRKKTVLTLLYLLTAFSFFGMLYSVQRDQSFAFYMFPTRAWELFAGGLAYFHGLDIKSRLRLRVRNGVGMLLLAILLLALSGFIAIGATGWPSLQTCIPVGCTALILAVAPQFRLFRTGVPVFIARISYTWYLWHWPIVVLCTYFALDRQVEQRVLFLGLSFLVSCIAYFLIEKPRFFRRALVLIVGLVLVALATFTGTQIPLRNIVPERDLYTLVEFQRTYTLQGAPAQYNFAKGHLLANAPFESFDKTQLSPLSDSAKNYLLLGDCHAGMFSLTLRKIAEKHRVRLLQATGDETFPVLGIQSPFAGPTALMNYMYAAYLPKYLDKIDKVIIAANYAGYSKKQLTAYLNQVTDFFAQYQVPVVYIGQTESYRVEFPVVAVLEERFAIDRRKYLEPARYYANQFLKQSSIAASYIDVYNLPTINHFDAQASYFYDADHLSFFGTEQYADLLERRIFLEGQ